MFFLYQIASFKKSNRILTWRIWEMIFKGEFGGLESKNTNEKYTQFMLNKQSDGEVTGGVNSSKSEQGKGVICLYTETHLHTAKATNRKQYKF